MGEFRIVFSVAGLAEKDTVFFLDLFLKKTNLPLRNVLVLLWHWMCECARVVLWVVRCGIITMSESIGSAVLQIFRDICSWQFMREDDLFLFETDSVTSILNNARKQESIREQIAACVKHHHNICRYIKMVQEYCYYTLSGQLFGVIVLLINFIYMILYVDTLGNHKLAIVTEFLNLAVGVYSYTYMGELFESQMCEILVACNQIKWYTFNSQNRKMFLIYIMNLRREYGLECLGLFAANLDICIWIFKKSFAVVSLLGALKNKAPNE